MPAGSHDRVVRGSVRKANELHEPRQHAEHDDVDDVLRRIHEARASTTSTRSG